MENLIPAVLEIRENKSYLRRLTALQACAMIALVVDDDTTRSELLPIILEMSADGVRLNFVLSCGGDFISEHSDHSIHIVLALFS